MASSIRDFTFNESDYGSTEKITGSNAVIYAIKNIIFSRPGNFPLSPNIGIDIRSFQFELMDDDTITDLRSKIMKQASEQIPNLDNIEIIVDKIEDYVNDEYVVGLGIAVSAKVNGEESTGNFLIIKDKEIVTTYNEVMH